MLRLATAGSVDDGKSTLIGRLLIDTKQLFSDQLEAVERASRERGATRADDAFSETSMEDRKREGYF
ncbi:MAG: sulfate adenylyltransferase subunit 1, partial [Chloroflexota bacterium]|nr:sulfate adenylyltransferase subunit 1 [Chloroflexota bacterium]